MNLLEKFDNYTINEQSLIPKEDQDFCERETKEFLQYYNQVNNKYLELDKEYREEQKLRPDRVSLELENNYRGGYIYVKRTDDYDYFLYTCAWSLNAMYQNLKKIKKHYIYKVFNYFKDKYQLDISARIDDDKLKDINEDVSHWFVIELLKEELGTLNFKDISKVQVMNVIKNKFDSWGNKFSIKNSTIELKGWIYYDRSYNSDLVSFKHDCEYLICLSNMFSLFERDEVLPDFELTYLMNKLVPLNENINLPNCEMVKSVRFFKSKVVIKFIDNQTAKQFWTRFEIHNKS